MSKDPLIGFELRLDQLLEQTKPRADAVSKRHAWDRFSDLQKQGFMRPPRKSRVRVPAQIVACNDCLNWHPRGKHTADAATRKANRAANKAAALRIAAVRAGVGGKARLARGERGPRGGRTDIQALLFPLAAGWTPATARDWARANGFNYGKVHTKGNHIRLRQADPGRYRRMRTICLGGACRVKAVIGVR